MSDTGSDPPRCRCGFWGSSQTGNLCSQCYKDEIKRSGGKEASSSLPELSSSQDEVSKPTGNSVEVKSQEEKCEGRKEVDETDSVSECATGEDSSKEAGASYLPKDRPIQKNKKKCWDCQGKLELAQRELGKCRCGYIYCQLHRLPEKHNCVFNHKESGREEARQKMVPAGPKKVGRSFQRMDE